MSVLEQIHYPEHPPLSPDAEAFDENAITTVSERMAAEAEAHANAPTHLEPTETPTEPPAEDRTPSLYNRAAGAIGYHTLGRLGNRVEAAQDKELGRMGRLARAAGRVIVNNPAIMFTGAVIVTAAAARGFHISHDIFQPQGHHNSPDMTLAAQSEKIKPTPAHPIVDTPKGFGVEQTGHKTSLTAPDGDKLVKNVTTNANGSPKLSSAELKKLHSHNTTIVAGKEEAAQARTTTTPDDLKKVHIKRTWHEGSNEQGLDISKQHTQHGDKVVITAHTGGTSHGLKHINKLPLDLRVTDSKHHAVTLQFEQDSQHKNQQVIVLDGKTKLGKFMGSHHYRWAEEIVRTNDTTGTAKHPLKLNELATDVGDGRGNLGTKPLIQTEATPVRQHVEVAAIEPATKANGHVATVELPQGDVDIHMPKGYNLDIDHQGDFAVTHDKAGVDQPVITHRLDASKFTELQLGHHGQHDTLPTEYLQRLNTELAMGPNPLKLVQNEDGTFTFKPL